MAISREPEGVDEAAKSEIPNPAGGRKKVVVIGLGMVGIAFM